MLMNVLIPAQFVSSHFQVKVLTPGVNNDGNIQNFQCPLGASGPSPPGNMSDFLKALDFSDEALLI